MNIIAQNLEERNESILLEASCTYSVQYGLKLDCDKLKKKKYNVNLKATVKITQQRVIANKPP